MHTKHAVHDLFHVHMQQQSMFKLHQLDKKTIIFVVAVHVLDIPVTLTQGQCHQTV